MTCRNHKSNCSRRLQKDKVLFCERESTNDQSDGLYDLPSNIDSSEQGKTAMKNAKMERNVRNCRTIIAID